MAGPAVCHSDSLGGGAPDILQGRRPDPLRALRPLPQTRTLRALHAPQLRGRRKTGEADRRGHGPALHAPVAARPGHQPLRRRARAAGPRHGDDPPLGRGGRAGRKSLGPPEAHAQHQRMVSGRTGPDRGGGRGFSPAAGRQGHLPELRHSFGHLHATPDPRRRNPSRQPGRPSWIPESGSHIGLATAGRAISRRRISRNGLSKCCGGSGRASAGMAAWAASRGFSTRTSLETPAQVGLSAADPFPADGTPGSDQAEARPVFHRRAGDQPAFQDLDGQLRHRHSRR